MIGIVGEYGEYVVRREFFLPLRQPHVFFLKHFSPDLLHAFAIQSHLVKTMNAESVAALATGFADRKQDTVVVCPANPVEPVFAVPKSRDSA